MKIGRSKESAALLPILQRFGVPHDGVLVVHSAIGLLSRQGFRAEAMIETLLEHVSDGNLFMPTMTWRTVTLAHALWDEVATPSHTGVLTEVFRTRYATARSIHPTHSVAGWGAAAQLLLSRHHVDSTPVSSNSPYGLMRDYDAYVLMIGVGLECCTAIHLPEEIVNIELYVRPPSETELYQCRDRHGIVHAVRTRRHPRLDRDFPQFSRPLSDRGLLEVGEIQGSPYTIVSLRDLLRHVFAALIQNPRATLRQPQPAVPQPAARVEKRTMRLLCGRCLGTGSMMADGGAFDVTWRAGDICPTCKGDGVSPVETDPPIWPNKN